MQISINVDETQFKELMDKSLATLPEEKLQEVVLEGFRTYLTNTNVLKELTIGGMWNEAIFFSSFGRREAACYSGY